MIGRRLLIQQSKNHDPEVWTVTDIRDSYFGRFVEFKTPSNDTIVAKLGTLYTVKFI